MVDFSNSGDHAKVLAGAGHSGPQAMTSSSVKIRGWTWKGGLGGPFSSASLQFYEEHGEKDKRVDRNIFFFLDSPPESKRQKSEEREIKQVGRDFLFIKNAP